MCYKLHKVKCSEVKCNNDISIFFIHSAPQQFGSQQIAEILFLDMGQLAENEDQLKKAFKSVKEDSLVANIVDRLRLEQTYRSRKKVYDLGQKQFRKIIQHMKFLSTYHDDHEESDDEQAQQDNLSEQRDCPPTSLRLIQRFNGFMTEPMVVDVKENDIRALYDKSSTARKSLYNAIMRQGQFPQLCRPMLKYQYEIGGADSSPTKRLKNKQPLQKPLRLIIICSGSPNCFRLQVDVPRPLGTDGEQRRTVKCRITKKMILHTGTRTAQLRGDIRRTTRSDAPQEGGPKGLEKKHKQLAGKRHIHGSAVPSIDSIKKACLEKPQDLDWTKLNTITKLANAYKGLGIDFILNYNPINFQVVFGLQKQLELFQTRSDGVLYCDATGTVVKKHHAQVHTDILRPIFLYSFVFQDPAGGVAIPVGESLQSLHNSNYIAVFCIYLRNELERQSKKNTLKTLQIFPNKVVCDYCIPLVNAVLGGLAPKKTNIETYLRLCHFKMVQGRNLGDDFIISFCHAHVIKAWTRHSSITAKKHDKKARFIIIRGAVAVMKAKTLKEARLRFRALTNLACSKTYRTEIHQPIQQQFATLSLPHHEGIDYENDKYDTITNEEETDDKLPVNEDEFLDHEKPEKLKAGSKFAVDFNKDYRDTTAEIDIRDAEESQEEPRNRFFNPAFIIYFLTFWLPFYPMWMEKPGGEDDLGGPTNGPVEGYYGNIKAGREGFTVPIGQLKFLEYHRKYLDKTCDATVYQLEKEELVDNVQKKNKLRKKRTPYKTVVLPEDGQAYENWKDQVKDPEVIVMPDDEQEASILRQHANINNNPSAVNQSSTSQNVPSMAFIDNDAAGEHYKTNLFHCSFIGMIFPYGTRPSDLSSLLTCVFVLV